MVDGFLEGTVEDAVAVIGETYTISCFSDDSRPAVVVLMGTVQAKCNVKPASCTNTRYIEGNWNGTTANFKIKRVSYYDAGTWTCQADNGKLHRIDLEVISKFYVKLLLLKSIYSIVSSFIQILYKISLKCTYFEHYRNLEFEL